MISWKTVVLLLIFIGALVTAITFGVDLIDGIQQLYAPPPGHFVTSPYVFIVRDSLIVGSMLVIAFYIGLAPIRALLR